MAKPKIEALLPSQSGHQFVVYGDSCSGVPGAPHEATHARVNAVVAQFDPPPEFIIFPGDEIIGLVPDERSLRQQWQHWFDQEMAWLDRSKIPIYHATGNHTTYDVMSEHVFADVMRHLPRNGPAGQRGLAYFVRRDDLLLIFIHTLWSSMGGEGHIETDWLEQTLHHHADARWKLVIGHHPAFPVNGYVGPYQRTIGSEYVAGFWQILRDNHVLAYLCSHILAFDVQCHEGVLQITSAGAGTAHRMPEDVEYLHAVQMAIDDDGLRYQVLDDQGTHRETLTWPPTRANDSINLPRGQVCRLPWQGDDTPGFVRLEMNGTAQRAGLGARQTLFAATDQHTGDMPLWIGLVGATMQLTVVLQPIAGRSPHYWLGPVVDEHQPFELDLLLHRGMGPGGILWRSPTSPNWSSFTGSSAWGLERLSWPTSCTVGVTCTVEDAPFLGPSLNVALSSGPSASG
ncbi:MAG: hypothetical protein AAGA73_03420 [Pseudomonadota bacterium]